MLSIKKPYFRKIKLKFNKWYKFYSQTQAFKKRYKKIDKALFERTLSNEIIRDYIKKWEIFGVKVEIDTFLLCYNLSGKIDYNIIPENIFAAIIEPNINKYKNQELSFLAIKNIYEKWFYKKEIFPKSHFHKINNIYYDRNFNIINDITSFLNKQIFDYPIICKPSLGTAGGIGVKVINNLDEIKKSINDYENLIYQEKIQQNEFISKINIGMNTIRTCLYRKKNGKFKVLNNSIRFGINGSLDNLKDGGVVCYIRNDGRLNDYAVKMYCEKYYEHPNSKIRFSDVTMPFYSKLVETAEEIANQIPLCNLVSLDMCLDNNNNWRCIEINLNSQTIRFSQYAGIGFFENYTDEVIHKILN